VAASLLLVASCSSGGAGRSDDGVVRVGVHPVSSMDPRKSGPIDTVYLTPVFDTLIERTPDGSVEPGLATEWQLAADGTRFDLTLREGVTFQDGTPMDAEAVKANILSAKEPGNARALHLSPVSGVTVVDPTHVRLELSGPAAQLEGVLAGEAGMMMSPASLTDPAAATKPIGAGPYRVEKYSPDEIRYEAWDGYWNAGQVKNEALVFVMNPDATTQFRALQSGQIDMYALPQEMKEAAQQAGLEVVTGPTGRIWQLTFNVGDEHLAKPEVRKAISLAVDRTALAQAALGSADQCVPTVQPFGREFVGHVDELDDKVAPDLAQARDLLRQAGHAEGFPLRLVSGNSGVQQAIAQIVQAELAKVGITVELEVSDQAEATRKSRAGDFDLQVNLIMAPRPDPTQYVVDMYLPGGVYNPGGYSLPGVAELLEDAQANIDREERQAALAEIVTSVHEDGAPTMPLCINAQNFAFPDDVSGFEIPVLGDFDFTRVSKASVAS
jgi:peptide/nickel transport system substrate-binding protein